MEESESMKQVENQTTIHAATAVMMALSGMDARPHPAPPPSLSEPQWEGHGRPALESPPFI